MRLIDADALLEELNNLNDYHMPIQFEMAIDSVKDAPTFERPRGEWISVEDRLPDPFVTVLVHMPQEKPLPTVHAGYISKDGEWVGGMFKRDKDEVTHWMPLPEAPDMKGEGE